MEPCDRGFRARIYYAASLWLLNCKCQGVTTRTRTFAAALLLLAFQWSAAAHPRARHYRCEATAFSRYGNTQLGTLTRRGVVAADPSLFPLGTVLRVTGAGGYSGPYVVTDTGSRIVGRRIDIYIPNESRAKRFGKRVVSVLVLHWGTLTANAAAPSRF